MKFAAAFLLLIVSQFGLSNSGLAGEPVIGGAFYGPYPFADPRLTQTPYSTYAWVGEKYLLKNKLIEEEWITNKKKSLLAEALAGAKVFAAKQGGRKYALDNMRFQVVRSANRISLYMDFNILVFR